MKRVTVILTIANSRRSPGPVDALTDVPDCNAPVIATSYINFTTFKRRDRRRENEMIMGLPSCNIFVARVRYLVVVSH